MLKFTFWPAFQACDELKQFNNDALLLYALKLRFGIEDILTTAATSLTEDNQDKKTDLIYIDTDSKHAVIVQAYMSAKIGKKEAPSGKASDLNAAVSWLLNTPLQKLPPKLQSHAKELRRSIESKEIKRISIWYVHNCLESKNVRTELSVVEKTTQAIIEKNYSDSLPIEIQSLEVGLNVIENWYLSLSKPILITDKFTIPIPGGYRITNADWEAYVTTVPAKWLHEQFQKYKTDLFSTNVRDYLGSRDSDENINFGIKETGEKDPKRFWVFNNGISALVHKFSEIKGKNSIEIYIEGISIVNGAQTTGALGSLTGKLSDDAMVPIRFIMCNNSETIYKIVKYNNSQNRIEASDYRSGDPVQTRLIREFQRLGSLEYLGRRGGHEDAIKRKPNLLPSVTAGQSLAALHRNPEVAYHQKTRLWESNSLYAQYFNDHTSAVHIIFAYSLLKAVEQKKINLLVKNKTSKLMRDEEKQLNFFRLRGSIFLLVSAIGNCLELILNKAIPNYFDLKFKKNLSLEKAVALWNPIIEIASAFTNSLESGLSDGLKNKEAVAKSIEIFSSLISSTKAANAPIFSKFSKNITD